MRDGEDVRGKEGSKWKLVIVAQMSRSYKVKTVHGEYQRNCRKKFLRTGKSQTEEVTTDDDLPETGAEPTSVADTSENSETQPDETSATITTQSGRILSEDHRDSNTISSTRDSADYC